jgi:hypothetical protein
MRYLLFAVSFFFMQFISAQKTLPDSTMKEFARLTCECATLMKIDQGPAENGIQNLGTCINSTIGVYENAGLIKKEWVNDSAWAQNFDSELQAELIKTCPVFKSLLDKLTNQVDIPKPLGSVDEKYFLAKESMTEKGMEENINVRDGYMRRWSAQNMNNAKIQMIFDIRYVFKGENDAASYYKIKLQDLSEGGELTTNSLETFGASESKVYGANPKLLATFGDLDMAQYNFVFRVNNIVAKVFVSASKKTSYEEAVVFAKEAIGRIKAVK